MIVDQAHRLHESVDGGGADEGQPRLLRSFDMAMDAADTDAVCGGESSDAFGSKRQT